MLAVFAGLMGTALAGAFPWPVHTAQLDNGLSVRAVPMPSPGVVSVATWMKVGSRDEVDAGRTGFAHFFEHLMFYGTERTTREQRERAILAMGIDDNAWTWCDETVYTSLVPTAQLDEFLALEADRFQHLALTPDVVRRESGAVYGEFRKGQASPGSRLYDTMQATVFTTHTYGHSTIGHEADIVAMPDAHAYAEAFFDRFYRPENATILVVGDVDPEALFAKVEALYGGWKPAALPRPELPAEPAQEEERRAHVDWPSPTAPRMAMGWRVPAHDPRDADLAALELAATWLLADVGPLESRLVRDEGLAFSVWGGRDDFVDPGLFRITVQAREAEDLPRIEAIVREELARLADGPDAAALARVQDHSRYAFLTSLDDPEAVASTLGWSLRRDPDPTAIDAFWDAFAAATAADVARVVRATLVEPPATVVTLTHTPEDAG
jgi:zinc protease